MLATGLTLAGGAMADQAEAGPASSLSAPGPRRLDVEISAYPLVFAQVRINDHPALALVDTGSSSPLQLSARLAGELQLALVSDPSRTVRGLDGRRLAVQRATITTFVAGGGVDRDIQAEVAADRIESIAAQVGTPFDVILGWGFLSRSDFTLDYRQRVLRLDDGPAPPSGRGLAVGYLVVNRLPMVPARWGGRDIQLLLDTGAPMCNIDADFAHAEAGSVVSQDVVLGTTTLALQWRAKDLSVMRTALGAAGALGNNLLGRYAVHVDTRNRRIHLDV